MEEGKDVEASSVGRRAVLALILAGGSGTRLRGLTEWRAKPAVPFGGHYRTVDFTLSNCINSQIRQVALLTQYKSQSLIRHIQRGWGFMRRELDEFIEIWPAQQRHGERWYVGTGDAVYQNRDLIETLNPQYVLVLAGDHVYSMDYSLMLNQHIARKADITVGCVEVPIEEAHCYGIVGIDRDARVRSFIEKPERPSPSPGRRGVTLASMGIYIFNASALFDCLAEDAADPDSAHDFGYSVLPAAISEYKVFSYRFRNDRDGTPGYWRDVGTVDAYWSAHMELLEERPKLDLFDHAWPVWTYQAPAAPARVCDSVRLSASIVGQGSHLAGDVHHSVISTHCEVGAHSRIKDSVLLPHVRVGKNCSLERVVIDSHCVIPDNTVIGGDLFDEVGTENCYLSPQGIVLLTRKRDRDKRSLPETNRKVA